MNDRFIDDGISQMIRDAYRDVRLGVPLARVVAGDRPTRRQEAPAGDRRTGWQGQLAPSATGPHEPAAGWLPRRRGLVAALAAAAATVAVTVGSWAYLADRPATAPPGAHHPEPPVVTAPATGKPARPTSNATTAAGRCADHVRQEAVRNDGWPSSVRTALPPLRFEQPMSGTSVSLLMFADDAVEVTCWLTPDGATVAVNTSNLTADPPVHTAGGLSYSSSAYGQEPRAAYGFGRAPAGTTRVEIAFPAGSPVQARLAGEWFLAWATGAASERFAEATSVTAYAPGGPLTVPIRHG